MNFPRRFSIHGPDTTDPEGPWRLMEYRFKWEHCPKEGSYIPCASPRYFTTLAEIATEVSQTIRKEEDSNG